MGFGVVGGGVARCLMDKASALSEEIGCPITLQKVKVVAADLAKPQVLEIGSALFTTDNDDFFTNTEIDIIVEAIGGESPALQYLERALSSGKHVVTPNKEVIAKHGASLIALALKNKVGLRYEGSVGGGIPLIAPFHDDLVANKINSIYAIINGTTNYILTRMAKEGIDFSIALSKAQEFGYAEANPENDIEGIDAVYKLAILTSLAFRTEVRPEDIYREGISRLGTRDFHYARELGYAIKLLAIAKQSNSSIEVRVHPVFVPEDSLLANVDDVNNAVLVEGDLVGKVLFFGKGAGSLPTTSAIIADIVSVARDITAGIECRAGWKLKSGKVIMPMSQIETRYYLRLNVNDCPGVLAQISRAFGDHLVSISSVIQKLTDDVAKTAEIVIMTHPAKEAAIQQALKELAHLAVVKEVNNFVRVETGAIG
jgi:homoserine dehydrogenase